MLQWLYKILLKKRNREMYNVTKLKWQKAELERKIALAKGEVSENT